jgi:hypothetical protein
MTTRDEVGEGKLVLDFPMTRLTTMVEDRLNFLPQVVRDQWLMAASISFTFPVKVTRVDAVARFDGQWLSRRGLDSDGTPTQQTGPSS